MPLLFSLWVSLANKTGSFLFCICALCAGSGKPGNTDTHLLPAQKYTSHLFHKTVIAGLGMKKAASSRYGFAVHFVFCSILLPSLGHWNELIL